MGGERTVTKSGLVIHGKRKVVTKTICLRDDQIELLRNISKFQGKSISKVVTELLREEMDKECCIMKNSQN